MPGDTTARTQPQSHPKRRSPGYWRNLRQRYETQTLAPRTKPAPDGHDVERMAPRLPASPPADGWVTLQPEHEAQSTVHPIHNLLRQRPNSIGQIGTINGQHL